ncbi:hypothetical protein OAC89_06215 [Deltaproteobacteria bacterium]|nr:hypothetical protein [Deltaproteobacteria bacterium]
MNLIRSLLGRRQFLIAFLSSALTLILGRFTRAFDLLFQKSIAEASEKPGTGERKPLKGIVVYYSATGSTGKIAGAIYRGMKTVMECDVAPLKKIDPKEMVNYDVIAIGSPNWFHREPANVRLFIYNMPHMAGKLCLLFNSHGASPRGYFYSLSQPMRKKGFTIIGWKDWYGDATHVLHMPQPYTTHGHPDEIDLMEAEAFGRQMAENSIRIYAGEKDLIPEIPTGPDADQTWIAQIRASGVSSSGISEEGPIPIIDTIKCIYPRCTACEDNCVVNAIDLSVIAPATQVSGSPIFIQGCINCAHPICERACSYDAISYEQLKTEHVIDMERCTYPKCTLCVDYCPMDSINFSQNPPVFQNNCEGCDLCYCICPEDAIDIPNVLEAHIKGKSAQNRNMPFGDEIEEAIASGKFRPLISFDEIGWDNIVYMNQNAPRVLLNEENYPYNVKNL